MHKVDRQPRRSSLSEFLRAEATSGLLLVVAAAVALVLANSPAGDWYDDLWHRTLTVGPVTETLQHWVNDGLMAVFFFVVGLEIKRELVTGELRRPRAAALPAVAALGGVLVPAFIYLAIAPAGPAQRGFGIPMATDIAFAVGVLALLGRRAAAGSKLFLLSIAIVDDILAIALIAIVYSGPLDWRWLAFAAGVLALTVAVRRRLSSPWWYVVPALAVWFAVFESGVHATIAGVALGLLTPARPVRGRPVLQELEHRLHPVSALVVVPLFALANAGVDLRGGALSAALSEPVTWAVVAGLVAGKALGIAGTTFGARRLRLGVLPDGMPPAQVWPVAALGGIGFTVALFIADLAFTDRRVVDQAKVGILLASVLAAGLGAALLAVLSRSRSG